jgi:predicted metal-dependent hydrolase
MTTELHRLQYGEHTLEFALIRKKRATLEIAVEPDATVVVTAPIETPLGAIVEKVRRRVAWVRRQQRFFSQYVPRTPERQFLPGETHLYLGRQYRLKVVPNVKANVKLIHGFIAVQSQEPDRPDVTRGLVYQWYREHAHTKFAERLETNLLRFPDPEGFRPSSLIIRRLRQRWGSMSPGGKLLLNRRLIEAPVDAIDYVITHELCHIAEPGHNTSFFQLLDRVLPDWHRRKERLERVMA